MTAITLAPPIVKEKVTTAEPKVGTAITAVETFLNSNKLDGTTNIKLEGIKETNLELALQEKLAATLSGLKIKGTGISITAATGEFIIAGVGGITITLPTRVENREVAVFNTAATAVKVKTNGGFFKGDFLTTEPAEVELMKNQHITVQCDANNWYIKAGEPRRTQTYGARVERAAATPFPPNATRPTQVSFEVNSAAAETLAGGIKIGGVLVQQFEVKGPGGFPLGSYQIFPGVEYEWTKTAGAVKVFTTYLVL